MGFHRRYLPHFYSDGCTLFVTFRLAGSLPDGRTFAGVESGKAFASVDRLLDRCAFGPRYLGREDVAAAFVEVLLRRADLLEWVVMPNHVHLLVRAEADWTRTLQGIKGEGALRCNRVLGRAGQFWQHESYDRVVREDEFARVARYILMNPVRAGLARAPGEFRWCSGFELRS
jgi:putative transposase